MESNLEGTVENLDPQSDRTEERGLVHPSAAEQDRGNGRRQDGEDDNIPAIGDEPEKRQERIRVVGVKPATERDVPTHDCVPVEVVLREMGEGQDSGQESNQQERLPP